MRIVLIIFMSSLALGCSQAAQTKSATPILIEVQEASIPGTVKEPWVEPMANTIKVPGQLDPTGTYYRSPHQTVIEIRPGRYQEVDYGQD